MVHSLRFALGATPHPLPSPSLTQFEAICTHMSDANPGSTYTMKQFKRVQEVVDEVRAAGIRIPMLHLENSESLLSDLIPDECE